MGAKTRFMRRHSSSIDTMRNQTRLSELVSPVANRQELNSLIKYLVKSKNAGEINDDQFTLILTSMCSKYIEHLLSEKLEDHLNNSLSSFLTKDYIY